MRRFNWEFDFDPNFPVHLFEYTVIGKRDAMHWHRYFEIGLCIEGDGTFLYSHKKYHARKGDIFITNNYENHVAITEEGRQNRYIFLILMPSFVSDSSTYRASRQYIETFHYNPPDFINRIACGSEIADKITPLLLRGLEVYTKNEKLWEIEVDIVVRTILLELTRHYYHKNSAESERENINPKILLAKQYINQNYSRTLTLTEVAQHVDLNISYFRHLFKQEMLISFKEYITHLRLASARTMLVDSNVSISRIIEEVGYTNISQFYRIFRQHYHMTPAEYRKQQMSARQDENAVL